MGKSPKKRVVVAMSGGVDSSVAAALLLEQGYEVVGMMLRLWSEPGTEDSNRCCTPEAMGLARKVASRLGIPFYALDVQEEFHKIVVESFIDAYGSGITPNPCLNCNRQIRFGFLLEQARSIGADYMATGHYARVHTDQDGIRHLLRSRDKEKDQSYVLHVLDQLQLQQALFPLGSFHKNEVRKLAADFQLPVAKRRDSQDLCFLAGDDYRNFLHRNAPQIFRPGEIKNIRGETIGTHSGLANYTVGQRKGLGIPSLVPMYVISKDAAANTIVVGEQTSLGQDYCSVGDVNWITGQSPDKPMHAQIKIRYKARVTPGVIEPEESGRVSIRFESQPRDITPGQAAVFYEGDEVLGGGIILSTSEDVR